MSTSFTTGLSNSCNELKCFDHSSSGPLDQGLPTDPLNLQVTKESFTNPSTYKINKSLNGSLLLRITTS